MLLSHNAGDVDAAKVAHATALSGRDVEVGERLFGDVALADGPVVVLVQAGKDVSGILLEAFDGALNVWASNFGGTFHSCSTSAVEGEQGGGENGKDCGAHVFGEEQG